VVSENSEEDKSETVKPRAIHLLKEFLIIDCFLSLEGVKVLEQILHLYLLDPEELVAQMIVLEELQKGHLKSYFLLHCVILPDRVVIRG